MGIGLTVNERESADPPAVVPADLGISAWPLRTRRGLARAVRIDSFERFKTLFAAEADPDYTGYYVVRGIYDNVPKETGATCYVSRVLGSGAVAASSPIASTSAATPGTITGTGFPLALSVGNTLTVNPNAGGAQATAAIAATQANIVGVGETHAAVTASHTLVVDIKVTGGTTKRSTVIFAGTENTLILFVAKINLYLQGGYADIVGGQIKLFSDLRGSSATGAIISGDADVLTSTGLSVGAFTAGTGNVADLSQVTAAELKALLDAIPPVNFTATLPTATSLKITSTTTGGSSSIQLGGAIASLVTGFDTGLHSGSASATVDIWQITAGQYGEEDVGEWANDKLFYQVVAASSGLTTERDLLIFYQSDLDSDPVEKFRHKNLTNSNVATLINHATRGSEWVTITVLDDSDLPDVMGDMALVSDDTEGDNGTTPAESAYDAAFEDFNGLNIQVIGAPDLTSALHATNLESYAASRANVLAAFTAFQGATDADLESTYPALLKVKSYMAGYRGWLRVDDEREGTILVPALGHLFGAGFIRKRVERGGFAHIAPAGPTASLNGVVEVDDGIYDQTRLTRVNKTGFNPIVFQAGLGFFSKTSRTFSTLDKWYSIHIRIQANFFKATFLKSFAVIEQEPNNEDTRRRLRNPIQEFMEGQFTAGGLDDEGGLENNLLVKCDVGNNGTAVRNARRMVCDVTYRPVEVAEDVSINLIRTTQGVLSATDS